MRKWMCVAAGIAVATLGGAMLVAEDELTALSFSDPDGRFTTITTGQSFDLNNPFFQSLGTNGRSCGSCHVASDAWSITPSHIQARFYATSGKDPIFRTSDGSNCADSDVSTFAKAQAAYSLLLNKGLIRVQLPLPSGAEFSVVSVDDPYGCAPIPGQIWVYRRVLPSTNLKFLSTVMWDGRETFAGQSLEQNLAHQVLDATLGHAQAAAPPTAQQIDAMVKFELATFTAQSMSRSVGLLDRNGGLGGPLHLSQQPFYIGMNDPLGNNPNQIPFTPVVFRLFTAFGTIGENESAPAARSSIRRGEDLFNTRQFVIDNVAGLPAGSRMGTCTLCHNTPNSGNHSVSAPLNIGLTDASLRTRDLPLYTLNCFGTNQSIQTTDPGRALITGKCADIGKFKGPILRALSARAPYFHNGSAATLDDVVDFYQTRFAIGLTGQERADLVAFLKSL
jgi:cytochrome c peroxidase